MTHGIPDAERLPNASDDDAWKLKDLEDALTYAKRDVWWADEAYRAAEIEFTAASIKREKARRALEKAQREYETFKSALAGQKDGRYA